MKKTTILLLMITLFSITLNAQNDYKNRWLDVAKLEVEGLPKSALKIVEEIYQEATEEKNSPQIIKSLFYKSKFSLTLEEDAQLKVINNFKSHIATSNFPEKNVLQNVLANLYWQYFTTNRYKFYNRTKTSDKVNSDDFRTWDLDTLFKEIHTYYTASLQDEIQLQNINIGAFADILIINKHAKEYRPTLYDFLANNALQFYKSSETSITKPSYKFLIDDPSYISDAKTFIDLEIASKDSLSLQLNALKVYQKLIAFHDKENNKDAFAEIDIQRLHFVQQFATFTDKEAELLKTLEVSKSYFKNHKASALYNFEIAKIYREQANLYSEDNTGNRFKNKDALIICDAIIKQFPTSYAAQKSKILKSQIEQKTLSILAEEYIPIDKNSKVLVTYKNVEKLFFSAFKINQKQLATLNKTYKFEERKAFINQLEKVKTWQHVLRNEEDYLQHKTEVVVPALQNGMYLILASETESIQDEKIYGTTDLQVTNLTLIENTFGNRYNYQIVDRNTGKPYKNAEIHLKNVRVKRVPYINKKLTTDKNGFASFKSNNYYRNVTITVKTKHDVATFGNHYLYENSNRNHADNNSIDVKLKPFIFTDRSIYRPGQTVYFKAIVLKKQGDKSEVFTKEIVDITLYDVNNQEVKTLHLKLNEFGSVAGEFIIPNNGLTGVYSIEIDESSAENSNKYFEFDYNNSISISVEEYKRPTFKTDFKPVIESYKINDSIKIIGFAKSFSGANITDAKVVYRVHRKVQYPSWYYWYRPQNTSEAQEISNGEMTTNSKGEFEIIFKAMPDESVSKESNPVFTYEITADVTDVNGETRSETTTVKVGYHSLIASISLDEKIDKSEKTTLTIATKNLNDEFVAATGIVKVYKLKSPETVVRERAWAAPDYQDISENEFRKLFPHEPYTNDENVERNWEKGELAFSKNFDTSKSKEIILENIKNWISGSYIVILESKDKFNQEVKDEKRFAVFSSKDKKVADNKLFTINTNKTTYKVGDVVELKIGSASKNMTVVVQVEKNHTIVDTHLVQLNNKVKTIKIPVHKDDIGGFAVKYHFVNYNYFESGSLPIFVPEKQEKPIEIITNIFRDKLQPGQNETWSFTIKDDENDAIAAEVLASMYDASLDEFKSHNWQFNPITPKANYYSYRVSNANKSFNNTSFYIKNIRRNYYGFPTLGNDVYNWFGFSLTNNRWVSQQYLRAAKNKINSSRTTFDGTITGFVADTNGDPLPGVSIEIQGTTFGAQTDFDGNYTINIKKGDVLVFKYLGFKNQEISIQEQTTLDVQLEEDGSNLEEVVVTGYGTQKKSSTVGAVMESLRGDVAGVQIVENESASDAIMIRGNNSINENQPLYIVDGKLVTDFNLSENEIATMRVLKDAEAIAAYGAKAANGVIIITTKAANDKLDSELSQIKARKNFNETAFFYPQLQTDKNGAVRFSFTMPEALTRWKLQLLAHTTDVKSAKKTLQTITQKELMIVPNTPRFLRVKDSITISAKITNLTNNPLSGFAKIILTDALTGKEITTDVLSNVTSQNNNLAFSVDKDGNTSVAWNLAIPEGVQAVQYKVVSKAGDFTDGEQNVLPVLTNRMLVTESLPMYVRSNQTKTFTLDKLINSGTSSTLKNHKVTLEMTSNPVWYAIQSLPYLMEYPYECSEQTFAKYYANTLASFIANSNPRIQEVFNLWKTSDALLSNLEKNQELKSIIIQETPWLRDAQSETEQKKRIALLFDLNKVKNEQDKALLKLQEMQMSSGGFSWFKGSRYPNNFITQHIVTGFGHLQKLGVVEFDAATKNMVEKAVRYLDDELLEMYEKLLERAKEIKETAKTAKKGEKAYAAYLAKNNLNHFIIQYAYMRSFHETIAMNEKTKNAVAYYTKQTATYWNDYNLYAKGQIAVSLFRNDDKLTAHKILKSLEENSITNDELGMYWKNNTAGYFYYQAPVETQALMIEVFSEILEESNAKTATIDNLKIWLLKNKQTNQWKTTKATTEAVYALLLNGSDWVGTRTEGSGSLTEMVTIKVGDELIDATKLEDVQVEAGTGYFKTSWNGNEIQPKMGTVSLTKKEKGIAWGALYWQYFEDLDKITAGETPLKLNKKMFLKVNSDTGKELKEITKNTALHVGDLITVRIELRSDRDMEFIHMKDMRAAGVEPINVLSTYKWQDNLGYYESTKDAATNFFFDRLPKGVYVFEYDVRVNNAGNFSNGVTTIQSMYAPEFTSHSEGVRLKVKIKK